MLLRFLPSGNNYIDFLHRVEKHQFPAKNLCLRVKEIQNQWGHAGQSYLHLKQGLVRWFLCMREWKVRLH